MYTTLFTIIDGFVNRIARRGILSLRVDSARGREMDEAQTPNVYGFANVGDDHKKTSVTAKIPRGAGGRQVISS